MLPGVTGDLALCEFLQQGTHVAQPTARVGRHDLGPPATPRPAVQSQRSAQGLAACADLWYEMWPV